jgi:Trk K+ transport system NAD-binding subunit
MENALMIYGSAVSLMLIKSLPEFRKFIVIEREKEQEKLFEGEPVILYTLNIMEEPYELERILREEEIDVAFVISQDDTINLNVCKILKDKAIPRIITIVNDPANFDEYKKLGVEITLSYAEIAMGLLNRLRWPRLRILSRGEGELIIFEVSGKDFMELREKLEKKILFFTVLREGRVVPQEEIRGDDVVLVVSKALEF